eukprot:scaffold170498_cov48-Prasinocladus_malaysianus.AAC.1
MPLSSSFASMCCNFVGMSCMVMINAACLGYTLHADQELILKAAEEGHHIGSGLVFSTASLLNALTTGKPLAPGYVATISRMAEAAAISCRWDLACSWKLQVQQMNGKSLECDIM